MPSLTLRVLLTDATGSILLVRRKRSVLWQLPGGSVDLHASVRGMLISLCRRQAGIAPDLVAPLFSFEFSGQRVVVGRDEVRRERARACGWIEAVRWHRYDALPVALDPVAAMAIALAASERVRAALGGRPPVHRLPMG